MWYELVGDQLRNFEDEFQADLSHITDERRMKDLFVAQKKYFCRGVMTDAEPEEPPTGDQFSAEKQRKSEHKDKGVQIPIDRERFKGKRKRTVVVYTLTFAPKKSRPKSLPRLHEDDPHLCGGESKERQRITINPTPTVSVIPPRREAKREEKAIRLKVEKLHRDSCSSFQATQLALEARQNHINKLIQRREEGVSLNPADWSLESIDRNRAAILSKFLEAEEVFGALEPAQFSDLYEVFGTTDSTVEDADRSEDGDLLVFAAPKS
jgi:hypothetical protein